MKTHQTVKLNRLQSDLKVAHYPPQPSAAVMRIMLNPAFERVRLATYGIHLDYICIYTWAFLKAPLIFEFVITSLIALRESVSLRPFNSSHHHLTSACLSESYR